MAGQKWKLWRRFLALSIWNRLAVISGIIALLSVPSLCTTNYNLIFPYKNELSEQTREYLEENNINSNEVDELLVAIQQEHNELISDIQQKEFITVISQIYMSLDTIAEIKLNKITKDEKGNEYRSDITIEKEMLGTKLRFLYRLHPFNNTIGMSDIESFKNHMRVANASKGIIISRGKFSNTIFNKARNNNIDLVTFRS